jgi:hypothetical protein
MGIPAPIAVFPQESTEPSPPADAFVTPITFLTDAHSKRSDDVARRGVETRFAIAISISVSDTAAPVRAMNLNCTLRQLSQRAQRVALTLPFGSCSWTAANRNQQPIPRDAPTRAVVIARRWKDGIHVLAVSNMHDLLGYVRSSRSPLDVIQEDDFKRMTTSDNSALLSARGVIALRPAGDAQHPGSDRSADRGHRVRHSFRQLAGHGA